MTHIFEFFFKAWVNGDNSGDKYHHGVCPYYYFILVIITCQSTAVLATVKFGKIMNEFSRINDDDTYQERAHFLGSLVPHLIEFSVL